MKNIFKNFDKVGLLTLAAAGLFTISWTNIQKSVDPEPGWYSITVDPDDRDNKSTQQINAFVDSAPPTGSCDVANEEKPCQVHLDLTNFSSSTPIEDMTVQQALSAGATITNGGTSSPDGYAREEE